VSTEQPAQAAVSRLIFNAFGAVLKNLHTRWARKPFSTASLWELISTSGASSSSGMGSGYYNVPVSAGVCLDEIKRRVGFGETVFKSIPWCVNFYDRMHIIREWLDTERIQVQGSAAASNNMFFQAAAAQSERSKGTVVRIRHSNLLADGIAAMNKINGSAIKDRIAVRYVNDFGIEEMVRLSEECSISGVVNDLLVRDVFVSLCRELMLAACSRISGWSFRRGCSTQTTVCSPPPRTSFFTPTLMRTRF
jgi:hypothetical protein